MQLRVCGTVFLCLLILLVLYGFLRPPPGGWDMLGIVVSGVCPMLMHLCEHCAAALKRDNKPSSALRWYYYGIALVDLLALAWSHHFFFPSEPACAADALVGLNASLTAYTIEVCMWWGIKVGNLFFADGIQAAEIRIRRSPCICARLSLSGLWYVSCMYQKASALAQAASVVPALLFVVEWQYPRLLPKACERLLDRLDALYSVFGTMIPLVIPTNSRFELYIGHFATLWCIVYPMTSFQFVCFFTFCMWCCWVNQWLSSLKAFEEMWTARRPQPVPVCINDPEPQGLTESLEPPPPPGPLDITSVAAVLTRAPSSVAAVLTRAPSSCGKLVRSLSRKSVISPPPRPQFCQGLPYIVEVVKAIFLDASTVEITAQEVNNHIQKQRRKVPQCGTSDDPRFMQTMFLAAQMALPVPAYDKAQHLEELPPAFWKIFWCELLTRCALGLLFVALFFLSMWCGWARNPFTHVGLCVLCALVYVPDMKNFWFLVVVLFVVYVPAMVHAVGWEATYENALTPQAAVNNLFVLSSDNASSQLVASVTGHSDPRCLPVYTAAFCISVLEKHATRKVLLQPAAEVMRMEVDALTMQLNNATEQRDAVAEQLCNAHEQLSNVTSQLNNATLQLDSVTERLLRRAPSGQCPHLSDVHWLTNRMRRMSELNQALQQTVEDLTRENEALEQNVSKLEQDVSNLEQDVSNLEQDVSNLTHAFKRAQTNLSDCNDTKQHLETNREVLHTYFTATVGEEALHMAYSPWSWRSLYQMGGALWGWHMTMPQPRTVHLDDLSTPLSQITSQYSSIVELLWERWLFVCCHRYRLFCKK